ncbi:large subunit ribosomal protein L21e [Pancytospora philotis]|nr:large subunit ribosomal protein L21e [Pancytospora philotis]
MRSHGYRRGTRTLFAKEHRKHGQPHVSKILQQFRVGDYVDCKVDSSVVKGMPHKYYHGKTGIVYNCNPHSYGVTFYRRVGGKYIERNLHVRVEHLTKSRCDEDSKRRYAEYRTQLAEARAKGEKISPVKRMPEGPRPAMNISRKNNTIVELSEKLYKPLF